MLKNTQTQDTSQATKRKIYCFCNGGKPGFYHALAIAEDGHVLAEHVCSDHVFIPYDLGVTSTWKHNYYDAHYGRGNWEVEFVADGDIGNHSGLNAALANNARLESQEP